MLILLQTGDFHASAAWQLSGGWVVRRARWGETGLPSLWELGRVGLQAGVPWPGFPMRVFGANLVTILTTPFSLSPMGLFN